MSSTYLVPTNPDNPVAAGMTLALVHGAWSETVELADEESGEFGPYTDVAPNHRVLWEEFLCPGLYVAFRGLSWSDIRAAATLIAKRSYRDDLPHVYVTPAGGFVGADVLANRLSEDALFCELDGHEDIARAFRVVAAALVEAA